MSDEEILNTVISHGVLRQWATCPRCHSVLQLDRASLMFRCNRVVSAGKKKKRPCQFRSSARVGTFFEKAKLSISDCVNLVAVLLHLKPPRQDYIMKNIGVASHTAVDWYSFCREVFYEDCIVKSEKLGGPGVVVEIDEAKFGKRKYNRGRRVEGQWVFGGVQRESTKSFLVPVETRDARTLVDLLKEWVLPGTTVYSDCWKAYCNLNNEGFEHLRVNHSITFVDPETGVHTNTVERTWREVRCNIPRYGVRKEHFVGYLAEYQFKRRYADTNQRLHHFLLAAAALYPPPPM